MRHAAIAAQIEIPLERFFREVMFVQALHQQVVIVNALTAAADFAVAFGRKHVKSERELGPLRVGLHVKGFEGRRIAMNEHRAVKGTGNDGFLVASEVVAKFGCIAVFVENRNSFFVTDAWKGRLDAFQSFRIALESFQFARLIFQDTLNDGSDQAFTHGQRFTVKLPALRQVGFLMVDVIDFEQSRRALAGGRREHGRVGEGVTLAVHKFARGTDGFGTNAKNGRLAWRTNPEMPVVEEEVHAVFLELDRKRRGFGNSLQDLQFRNPDFVAARSALFRANLPGNDNARFLRQALQRFERFGILLERADALNSARAVPKDGKKQLAGLAQVVKPALERDFLPLVFPGLLDRYRCHSAILSPRSNEQFTRVGARCSLGQIDYKLVEGRF